MLVRAFSRLFSWHDATDDRRSSGDRSRLCAWRRARAPALSHVHP